MRFIKQSTKKTLLLNRDEAFDLYVKNNPVISRLIHEIGIEIVQQAYYGNDSATIHIGTDDKKVLDSIYQVLDKDGYKHSFNIVDKVLTVNIL